MLPSWSNPIMKHAVRFPSASAVPLWAPLLALWLALPASAAQPLGCLIEAERVADVGSPVVGVIDRVEVERGDHVVKGQVLAVLRAPVEHASLNVASSRAQSSAELQAALASAKFNRERLQRAEDLFRKEFISQQALAQARAEADLAEQKLVQAREQRELTRQERDVAAAQVAQRVIRSPIDGVVAERYVSAGERVDEKPLLRIAKVDPLRVQLVVPVALYLEVRPGAGATVVPELPGAAAMAARVTMVDKVIDPASNTFRVHLELPNQGGALPAGLRCRAEFGVPPVPVASPPGASDPAEAAGPVNAARPAPAASAGSVAAERGAAPAPTVNGNARPTARGARSAKSDPVPLIPGGRQTIAHDWRESVPEAH
jgi:RND family efflux transporter MFP subunit